jgi:hypothetical protein
MNTLLLLKMISINENEKSIDLQKVDIHFSNLK